MINVKEASSRVAATAISVSSLSKVVFYISSTLFISITPATANAAYVLDKKSQDLANCVDIFSYATNWFMLENNQGAAKLMLFQQARASTALMSMHYDNGVVKAERVAAFSANRDFNRKYLDAHPSDRAALVDNCVATTSIAAQEQSNRHILMWGKSYSETVEALGARLQTQLGLR